MLMNYQLFTCNLRHRNRNHGSSPTRVSTLLSGRWSLSLLPHLFFPSFLDWGALSKGTVLATWGAPSLIVIPFSLLFFAADCAWITGGPWITAAAFYAACLSFSAAAFYATSSLFWSWIISSIETISCCSGHTTGKKESKLVTIEGTRNS